MVCRTPAATRQPSHQYYTDTQPAESFPPPSALQRTSSRPAAAAPRLLRPCLRCGVRVEAVSAQSHSTCRSSIRTTATADGPHWTLPPSHSIHSSSSARRQCMALAPLPCPQARSQPAHRRSLGRMPTAWLLSGPHHRSTMTLRAAPTAPWTATASRHRQRLCGRGSHRCLLRSSGCLLNTQVRALGCHIVTADLWCLCVCVRGSCACVCGRPRD